jgi:hypothetical protein
MNTIKVKKDKNNPYVMLNKEPLNDTRLSWKAKGLLSYLLSLPDNWEIKVSDLKNRSKDGRDATSAAMKELEVLGYLSKKVIRNKGKFEGYDYTVTEKPFTVNPTLQSIHSNKSISKDIQSMENTSNLSEVKTKEMKPLLNPEDNPFKQYSYPIAIEKYIKIIDRTFIKVGNIKSAIRKDSKTMRTALKLIQQIQQGVFVKFNNIKTD